MYLRWWRLKTATSSPAPTIALIGMLSRPDWPRLPIVVRPLRVTGIGPPRARLVPESW